MHTNENGTQPNLAAVQAAPAAAQPAEAKPKKPRPPLKQYTVGEEVFNAVSHGVGALLSIIGGSVLVTLAVVFDGPREVVACTIYAFTLVLLYTMSTLYHAFPWSRLKRIFRVFDHSTIFLLIAGTYTPFMLISLGGTTKGLLIFIAVWVAAIVGVTLNAFSVNRFAKLSMVLYLVMGWCVIFAIFDVVNVLPAGAVILLIAGGVAYTAGVGFYAAKQVRYMHSIWHLFVLLGGVLHYLSIAIYVLPKG